MSEVLVKQIHEASMKILEQAKEEAKAMLADDPALDAPEHSALRRRITKLFGEDLTLDL